MIGFVIIIDSGAFVCVSHQSVGLLLTLVFLSRPDASGPTELIKTTEAEGVHCPSRTHPLPACNVLVHAQAAAGKTLNNDQLRAQEHRLVEEGTLRARLPLSSRCLPRQAAHCIAAPVRVRRPPNAKCRKRHRRPHPQTSQCSSRVPRSAPLALGARGLSSGEDGLLRTL